MATTREQWDNQFSTKPCACVPVADMDEVPADLPEPCGHGYCPYEWCPLGSCEPTCTVITGKGEFCGCACHG